MNEAPQIIVHHFVLDPFSRRLRLSLSEHGVAFALVHHLPWQLDEQFLALSPFGDLPVLVDSDGACAVGILAAGEYVEERFAPPEASLLGATAAERAETRRLLAHFDGRLHGEVTAPLLMEKVFKRFLPREQGGGPPDVAILRKAAQKLKTHLTFIGQLAEERGLLAGPRLSLADLAAAAHLSVLEYLDVLRWEGHEAAKVWYQRIKSRPAFRALLKDRLPGLAPASVYGELDF